MKNYIKIGLWIFILSVLYASGAVSIFGFTAKLPVMFAFLYGLYAKSIREKIVVSFICGVIFSALGGEPFVPAVLCTVYSALLISAVFSGDFSKYSYLTPVLSGIILFAYEFIVELSPAWEFYLENIKQSLENGAVNLCFAVVLYPIIKHCFEEKERYIF